MSESESHKKAKAKAAGSSGKTEKKQKGGTRLDAVTSKKAVEVERSGDPKRLEHSAKKLGKSGKSQKVLQVPQHHMPKAEAAMKKARVSGTVMNMGETKRKSIRSNKVSDTIPPPRPKKR